MRTFVAFALALAAGCKDTGGGTTAGDAVTKMAAFKDAMCACKDEACAKKISDEMAAWGSKQPATPSAMNADEQKRAAEIGRQLGDCLSAVMSARGSAGSAGVTVPHADAGAPVAAGSAALVLNAQGLPAQCDEYKAVVERVQSCTAMSEQARKTLLEGYEAAATRWATLDEPSRALLAPACTAGAEAVVAAAKTQCGW